MEAASTGKSSAAGKTKVVSIGLGAVGLVVGGLWAFI